MDKLIELLTEHCRKHYWFKDNDDIEIDTDSVCFHLYFKWERLFPIRVETVICKDFGFIKWLVENEKIDLEKVKEKIWIPCFVWYTEWEISCVNDKEDYEQLLMALAIQDEPINFLISILK